MKSLLLAGALLAGSAVAGEPDDLVKKLGSSIYPVREAAHRELAGKKDQATIEALLKAMKSGDTEVAKRAGMILEPYLAVQKEKAILGQMQKIREACGSKLPFIDTSCIDWQTQRVFMDQAR